nr:flavonoid O-methyltransferase 7 [Scutellaria baicalensis]
MGEVMKEKESEENDAKLEIWKYALGFTPMAVVKCAIQLKIADVLQIHGGEMTHAHLSAAVACSPPLLHRIMRYLIHKRFFKQTLRSKEPCIVYTQTPLSKLLMQNEANSMAALVLLESTPTMLAPWQRLSSRASAAAASAPFEAEHGLDIWEYASANPNHSKLIDDGMGCIARMSMAAILDQYPEAFNGIETLVDVGGGDGTTLRALVKTFPWIHGINFDLPHVVSVAPLSDGVEHVAGDMFDVVPRAHAAFLMSVLHDWSDEECIEILKRCREAIQLDTGKVIIVEAVIEEGDEDKYSDVRLALDMVMLAHTERGKERTYNEWEYVVKEAGFSRFTVTKLEAIVSVIEAYP